MLLLNQVGVCVRTCAYICFKYYPVMTYSYKYYEAISFEATAFVGFPQIHPFVQTLVFSQLHNGRTMQF